jgi:hypothetical protein
MNSLLKVVDLRAKALRKETAGWVSVFGGFGLRYENLGKKQTPFWRRWLNQRNADDVGFRNMVVKDLTAIATAIAELSELVSKLSAMELEKYETKMTTKDEQCDKTKTMEVAFKARY